MNEDWAGKIISPNMNPKEREERCQLEIMCDLGLVEKLKNRLFRITDAGRSYLMGDEFITTDY